MPEMNLTERHFHLGTLACTRRLGGDALQVAEGRPAGSVRGVPDALTQLAWAMEDVLAPVANRIKGNLPKSCGGRCSTHGCPAVQIIACKELYQQVLGSST